MTADRLNDLLRKLDWTAPYADLFDTVLDLLYDLEADRDRELAKDPDAWLNDLELRHLHCDHDATRDDGGRCNDYLGKRDDDLAAWADRIVLRRLK